MEEDKYFTPNIEDFHVGYECEVNWNRAYEEAFIPIKLKICDELDNGVRDCYCSNVEEVLIAYDDGYAEFRTPYLTKEQIEDEGWKVEQLNGSVYINFDEAAHILRIVDYNGDTLFNGECKSINEFRWVYKLLKI